MKITFILWLMFWTTSLICWFNVSRDNKTRDESGLYFNKLFAMIFTVAVSVWTLYLVTAFVFTSKFFEDNTTQEIYLIDNKPQEPDNRPQKPDDDFQKLSGN